MAGNVTAKVVDSTLIIRGDSAANWIELVQRPSNQIEVRGGASPTTINGGRASFNAGLIKTIDCKMGAGDDVIDVKGPDVGGLKINNATFDMGEGGVDGVILRMTVKQNLKITAKGRLNVDPLGNRVVVNGTTTIVGGVGDDSIKLYGAFNVLQISTGNGNDSVVLADAGGKPFTAKSVDASMGAGKDKLNLMYNGVVDRVFADLGADDDNFLLMNWKFNSSASINGGSGKNLFYNHGGASGKITLAGFQKG